MNTQDSALPPAAEPQPLAAERRQALRETLVAAAITTLALIVAAAGMWSSVSRTIRDDYQSSLATLASTAALMVDPDLHRSLNHPSLHNGEDYLRAVEPLRRLRTTLPEVRYIYTAVKDGGVVRFVLDAALPGDQDGDGVEDQSQLWEIYTDSDPAMLAAFGDGITVGHAAATDQPYNDKWGSFMTGWAPLVDEAGVQFGALGIDVDANLYAMHVERAALWALLGALPATVLILLGSIGFHRVRLRGLAAARVAAHTSRELGIEQQRLRNVVEGTRVGMWETVVDPDTQAELVHVDERWAAMLGRRAAELSPIAQDRFMAMLVHPEDVPSVYEAMDSSAQGDDRIFNIDARMRHADGRWIWTEVRGRVIERDAQDRALRVVGTQMDVSDRKAAELSLREQQGSFRSLFELSPVGICLMEFPAGRFLKVNDALVATLGYSREDLLALTYLDITPEEYRESDRAQVSMAKRNTRFGPYTKEFLHKEGRRIRVLMSGARMKDAAGRDVMWVIMQALRGR